MILICKPDFRAVATYEKTVLDHRTGRKCTRCGGVLLDSIVNFGDYLPAEVLDRAYENAKKADLCLVLGSSLTIPPANKIPQIVGKKKSAKLAICNLQSTPIDNLSDVRIFTKTDDLMIRVMEKLDVPIPEFILHRRLIIDASMKNGSPQLNVSGVDEDGTPVTFLQSVKLEYNRRLLKSEPFIFNFRGTLEEGLELKFELEFMGHYGEPNLEITYEYHESSEQQTLYLLDYDPMTGVWSTNKQDSTEGNGDVEHEIIDLTEDTTILTVSDIAG